MNPESILKLQSYLDGELPPAQASEVAQWLARDGEAQALHDELQRTKNLLAGNELDLKLPESREFYWSKIERQIAEPARPEQANSWLPIPVAFRRWLAPLAGGIAMIVLAILVFKPSILPQQIASYFHEIDTTLEEDDAISFHSQEAGMTVVWIAAK